MFIVVMSYHRGAEVTFMSMEKHHTYRQDQTRVIGVAKSVWPLITDKAH